MEMEKKREIQGPELTRFSMTQSKRLKDMSHWQSHLHPEDEYISQRSLIH
jgi:hypothetical protein